MRTSFLRLLTCQLVLIAAFWCCTKNSGSPTGKMAPIREINQKEITSQRATIAITGATIIDGTGGTPIQNGCVVVTDGVISAVGGKADIKIPANAQVMNADGLTLLPGFIDSHSRPATPFPAGMPSQFRRKVSLNAIRPLFWRQHGAAFR